MKCSKYTSLILKPLRIKRQIYLISPLTSLDGLELGNIMLLNILRLSVAISKYFAMEPVTSRE